MKFPALLLVLTLTLAAAAQQPAQPAAAQTAAAQATTAPATDLGSLLQQVEQTSMGTIMDIGKLRIEKWKTGGGEKQQYQSSAESLQRNMTSALPELLARVRTSPDNLAANFTLYRNLNAIYEVLSSLTEATGAFGPKDDYQMLLPRVGAFDEARRNLADRLEALAQAKEAELARLRGGATQQSSTTAKKIVIDDTKPAPKKKKKSN